MLRPDGTPDPQAEGPAEQITAAEAGRILAAAGIDVPTSPHGPPPYILIRFSPGPGTTTYSGPYPTFADALRAIAKEAQQGAPSELLYSVAPLTDLRE